MNYQLKIGRQKENRRRTQKKEKRKETLEEISK